MVESNIDPNQLTNEDLENILNTIKEETIRPLLLRDPFTSFLNRMKIISDNENYKGMRDLLGSYFVRIKDENKKLFEEYKGLNNNLADVVSKIETVSKESTIKEVLAKTIGSEYADVVMKDYKRRGILDEIKVRSVFEYLKKENEEKIKKAFNEWRGYIANKGSSFYELNVARYLR